MRVLFIGGTGNISSACVERALELGYKVSLLNRGRRPAEFSAPVETIIGDRNDPDVLVKAARKRFDVVANFVGYEPAQIEKDIAAFEGQTGQYIFVSTASAYQKPPNHYLITESTPLRNPYWEYSRLKIACEDRLLRAYRESGFPMTIVRPSYTYGPTWIPCSVGGHGYTVVGRMRRGQPIICHGDGTSLWVMTFRTDFALGFVGLFGNECAVGEAFHITSDEVLTWEQIHRTIARRAGCQPEIVYVSARFIQAIHPAWGPGLLGDKAHSVVFDNSKIKRLVPEFEAKVSFSEGIRRSLAWHDADPRRQVIDEEVSSTMDRIIAAWRRGATGGNEGV